MMNIEKYNDAFVEVFGVDCSVLNDNFSKENVESPLNLRQYESYTKPKTAKNTSST